MMSLSVMRADYLQRFRSPTFWLVLLGTAFAAFLMFPGANAKYSVMDIYGYRGLYNSAWMGDTIAVMSGMMLPLFAFYIFKNAIELDRKTGVDILLESSPLKNRSYLTGKWLSNVFLMFTLILLINLVAIIKQFYLGESYEVDLISLFRGQIIFAIPAVFATASLALLFESLPVLRGGIGNMIFLFIWILLLVLRIEANLGAGLILTQMQEAVDKLGRLSESLTIGGATNDTSLATFTWDGIQPTMPLLVSQFYVIVFALVALFISILVFKHRRGKINVPGFFRKKSRKTVPQKRPGKVTLTPLSGSGGHFGIFQLFRGELRLVFRSHHLIWYGGAILLIILGLTLPTPEARDIILPITALWGTLIHSQLGCRDKKHNMEVLTGCTSFGESIRLIASWFSGVVLQLTLFAGLLVHFFLAGEVSSITMLVVAALFIPALAISLGRVTTASRSFEFVYMLIWYVGPIDRTFSLDFLGTTLPSEPPQVLSFLIATAVLLGITVMIGQKERVLKIVGH